MCNTFDFMHVLYILKNNDILFVRLFLLERKYTAISICENQSFICPFLLLLYSAQTEHKGNKLWF